MTESIPTTTGMLDRPRLLQALHSGAQQALRLIVAPPGYGKTTLAAQYAYQTDETVVWHTLSPRERDLPNLVQHSLETLRHVIPDANSVSFSTNVAPSESARQIADYLDQHLSSSMLYIFDDLHHLVGGKATETWLSTLIENLPRKCHLLLVGRSLPPLPLTRFIARNALIAIGQRELAFTTSEIQVLIEQTALFDSSSSGKRALVAEFEGWPAGTALTLQPFEADLQSLVFGEKQSPESLFFALAQPVLEELPEGLQDFLRVSSTLTTLSPEICTQALGLVNVPQFLTEVNQRQLFISNDRTGLRYHSLFRRFLQTQFKMVDLNRFLDCHKRSAEWFADHLDWEAAFDHFVEAQQMGKATAIADRVAHTYFTQGKVETLLAWDEIVKQADVAAPRLAYAVAEVHIHRYDEELAEQKLDQAHKGFAAYQDRAGLVDVQLQKALLDMQRGYYVRAVKRIEPLLETLDDLPGKRGVGLNILGFSLVHMGEVDRGIAALEAALPLYRNHSDVDAVAAVLQNLEIAYIQAARFAEADRCLSEFVTLQRLRGETGQFAMALNNQGYNYHLRGHYALARQAFEEGLAIAQRLHHRRSESYLHWSVGDLDRDLGAFDRADQHYRQALTLARAHEPILHCGILLSQATLYHWQDRLQDAAQAAEQAQALAVKHGLKDEHFRAQVFARTFQTLAEPSSHESPTDLIAFIQAHDPGRPRIDFMQMYTLGATAALYHSKLTQADHVLRSLVSAMRETNIVQPLVSEAFHNAQLWQYIQRSRTIFDALFDLIRQLEEAQIDFSPPEDRETVDPSVTFTLRVWSLGQERIERNGQMISASNWTTTIARQFFLYLVFSGPQTREQICLTFWPDLSPRQVRSNFHTTLYRVRQKLGADVIRFEDDFYCVNPDLSLWCDIYEFEVCVRQARLGSPDSALTYDLWQRAANLYQGDFLPSLDHEWILARRESLRELYIESLLALSNCAQRHQDYETGLNVLRIAIGVDPYREDIHRAMMRCYADLGELARVVAQFDSLRTLLETELGIEPSEETRSLADQLLN